MLDSAGNYANKKISNSFLGKWSKKLILAITVIM